jgi:hypothetical protein
MSRPLRSTPITGASPLLRAGPPARAATVLSTSRFRPVGALPLAPPLTRDRAVSAHAFPRSTRKPQTGLTPPARRTPPGQSAGTRQAHPGIALRPRFRCRFLNLDASAVVHSRSSSRSPPDGVLPPPFPRRSARQSSANAPRGGLTPPPAGRRRRATSPSSSVQQHSDTVASYLTTTPLRARGATMPLTLIIFAGHAAFDRLAGADSRVGSGMTAGSVVAISG